MTTVIVLHHVQGLTSGIQAFAEALRAAGHEVNTPDLFDGRTFDSIEAGMAHVEEVGFETVLARGQAAIQALPERAVLIGFSLGVVAAQWAAQTRPGALGAVLAHSCAPHTEFGSNWPLDVPVQIHAMRGDEFLFEEGDNEAAEALVAHQHQQGGSAELFWYDGEAHLFADSSVADFDASAAAMFTERVLALLASVERTAS